MEFSVIIPVYNEDGSVKELFRRLTKVLNKLTSDYEILFIDDGSTDNTLKRLIKLRGSDDHVKVYSFQKNFGKSSALMAGFKHARGKIVFTMDGDLQDDPKEIPRFIKKLNEGYDMVSGWKYVRHDPFTKTIPSKFYNWLTAWITGAKVHDSNCGYKAYKKKVVKQLRIHEGFHRYIPAMVQWLGYQIGEIKVTHHPREFGKSKYGPERLVKGLLDLFVLRFIYSNNEKIKNTNINLERALGVGSIVGGLCAIGLAFILSFTQKGYALFALPVVLIPIGLAILSYSRLNQRFRFGSSKKQSYAIKRIYD